MVSTVLWVNADLKSYERNTQSLTIPIPRLWLVRKRTNQARFDSFLTFSSIQRRTGLFERCLTDWSSSNWDMMHFYSKKCIFNDFAIFPPSVMISDMLQRRKMICAKSLHEKMRRDRYKDLHVTMAGRWRKHPKLIVSFGRPTRAPEAHSIEHSNDTHDLNWALWYFSFEEPALSSPVWTMFLSFFFCEYTDSVLICESSKVLTCTQCIIQRCFSEEEQVLR
jgi:hypothetical protein